MKWTPIDMGGGHAVCMTVGGQIIFCRQGGSIIRYPTLADAKAACRQLNGAPMDGASPESFEEAIAATPMHQPMVDALRDICVHGKTWKAAAEGNGVTESGILRAMRRLQARWEAQA